MTGSPDIDILIYEKLSLIPSCVDIEVVLEDLLYMDEHVRSSKKESEIIFHK